MAQLLTKIALVALVLCSVGKLEAQAHKAHKSEKPAEPEAPVLSADDTAAYINTTLHKYPSLEFVASGCSGYEQVVSISEDRRSLIIKQNFYKPAKGSRCGDVETLTFPVFNLALPDLGTYQKQGQHSAFLLECANRTDCVNRRAGMYASPLITNQWFLNMTGPDQISDGMKKAIKHLVDSLLIEADSHIDAADAFASRPH